MTRQTKDFLGQRSDPPKIFGENSLLPVKDLAALGGGSDERRESTRQRNDDDANLLLLGSLCSKATCYTNSSSFLLYC